MSRIPIPRIVSHDSHLTSATPAAAEPLLLTPREASRRLNVSEKTLHRLSAHADPPGTIPVVRIGKRGVRYTAAALEQWIADQEAASLAALEGKRRA